MRRHAYLGLAALLAAFLAGLPAALANVVARVDLTAQSMTVSVKGQHVANWPISSGRKGYRTPTGSYRPTVLRRMHYSSKYNNSPMPFSVFFHRGYAIHGTEYLKQLGRPASHGCIRLHPNHAAMLFNLIRDHGMRNTRITITY